MRIINVFDNPKDEENYGYILCGCLRPSEGLEIPRPDQTQAMTIICPRCGRTIQTALRGKIDNSPIEI